MGRGGVVNGRVGDFVKGRVGEYVNSALGGSESSLPRVLRRDRRLERS